MGLRKTPVNMKRMHPGAQIERGSRRSDGVHINDTAHMRKSIASPSDPISMAMKLDMDRQISFENRPRSTTQDNSFWAYVGNHERTTDDGEQVFEGYLKVC